MTRVAHPTKRVRRAVRVHGEFLPPVLIKVTQQSRETVVAPCCAFHRARPYRYAERSSLLQWSDRVWPVGLPRLELPGVDWQLAQAFASGGKDSVGYSGRKTRGAGLAQTAGWLGALDDVDLDRRRLVHAQDPVAIEV